MMNQVQWGAPVKKVSDITGAPPSPSPSPSAALLVPAPLPQADERQHAQHGGAPPRERGAVREAARRGLRLPRQPRDLWPVHEQVERVEPAEGSLRAGAAEP